MVIEPNSLHLKRQRVQGGPGQGPPPPQLGAGRPGVLAGRKVGAFAWVEFSWLGGVQPCRSRLEVRTVTVGFIITHNTRGGRPGKPVRVRPQDTTETEARGARCSSEPPGAPLRPQQGVPALGVPGG